MTPTLERVVWPVDRRVIDGCEEAARIQRVYAPRAKRRVRLRDRLLSMLTTRASS